MLFRTSVAENFATMTLGDFVSDSFTIYRDAPRQFLEIPRVQRALEIVG